MAALGDSPASSAPVIGRDLPGFPSVPLSADAAPFTPQGADVWQRGAWPQTEAERLFCHCAAKVRGLRADSSKLRDELNLLFDQLISEPFNRSVEPNFNIQPEDVCILLVNATRLVPMNQEHLVVKLCKLVHHLLHQLKVIMDKQTLDILLKYLMAALEACSTWTHLGVLQALATVIYGNGQQCHQQLDNLLGEGGVLLLYGAPSQPDMDLRHAALTCMANICVRISGQPPLDDGHKSVCFSLFLQTLQVPRPDDGDELFYCIVLQAALKGLHCCLLGGKWKFGGDEVVGSVLAALKRLMFQGTPGVSVTWPAVLYPAPLSHYESPSARKPEDEAPKPPEAAKDGGGKATANKKRRSRGKAKKPSVEEGRRDDEDNGETAALALHKTGSEGKASGVSLYPSWKRNTSDSEFSDSEGSAQSKLRLRHARVRQGALHCLLAVVKWVEKRTLYGYWSSFIPEAPVGNGAAPPLTLLTIILKDPSPKVRMCALQALSAMLDGSRQFLAVAEDTASPRTSYTPFSFTLATAVRELHRSLSLALMAETSPHTLTQVIKCLAHLVSNAPYHRLRPGLLSSLWKQIRPYVRHRDTNVRVSALTLYGALVTTQAPLPEVQLLLQQPEGSSASGGGGSFTPQDSRALSWRQPGDTPSPRAPRTPKEAEGGPPWLLTLCAALVTQPRDEHSDSEGVGGLALEPSPVRLEALQVLSHLVRGYISLSQACLCEIGQLCARCLAESDPSIQLHGAKLLEELGTGIIQQYQAESDVPEGPRVPLNQVVQFWTEVLSGPLNGALQNQQHPTLQTSACDTLASILPQAFAQLPDKMQLMCITVLLGLTYSDSDLVKMAAVRALGVYVLFPCLREDLMFVADTANSILAALDDRSSNIRAKAAWSLGNLTDTLLVNMDCVEVDFQKEMSDMLLLKMLQAATRSAADKDKVKCNAVRAIGNLLHFLREAQLSRAAFRQPLEDAMRALVKTVQSVATMKVRWNACYALGKAFKNPDLPLESACWSGDALAALCNVVGSCKNFKVRIKSAAALAVPAHRRCYGDAERFGHVWRSLAAALRSSEETDDFLEYRYSASLRHTLSRALLHLLRLGLPSDLPAISASLAGEEGGGLREHLLKYLRAEGVPGEEKDAAAGDTFDPQQRVQSLQQMVQRLKAMEVDTEESAKAALICFLEDLLKDSEEP
ncbi:HEAT repeat-containing protein 6 isoform X2 [Hippocampus comes]|uniref:HEAT repeat-containing protein 6 isoform X1 n=1 Tax=Hippocampus comes TaxID=109280 RepID=UPI00094E4146|nr:PREDICTED: HEAT repeat-containing protein 6 isoform X1 [Hippocampus comes]XP_019725207.1 PREDICTED: HEAT repeat-containing protein 6 isoform X2 [Hippocampus comes]